MKYGQIMHATHRALPSRPSVLLLVVTRTRTRTHRGSLRRLTKAEFFRSYSGDQDLVKSSPIGLQQHARSRCEDSDKQPTTPLTTLPTIDITDLARRAISLNLRIMRAPRCGAALAVFVSCAAIMTRGACAAPCDIYAAGGTPCAAAHSVVRALFSGYSGRLYQLKRFNDNSTLDIKAVGPHGLADTASHDAFCAGAPVAAHEAEAYPERAACVVWQIYDQTPNGNHL